MRSILLLLCFSLAASAVWAQTTGSLSDTLTVSSSSGNTTWHTGDTLTFCFTVDSFTQVNSNWFHGVEIKMLRGLDSSSITPISIATGCDGSGSWVFSPGFTSTGSNTTVGAGFYYDSGNGGPLDGNPGNNYGDNCAVHNWTFCWKVLVGNCTGSGNDSISLKIQPYPDGITGSFTSNTPYPAYIYKAAYSCCTGIQYSSTSQTQFGVCNGTATVTATAHPPYTYHWSNGGTTASQSGLCPGTYGVTVTDATGCVEGHLFSIAQYDTLTYTYAAYGGCYPGNAGLVRVNVSAGTGPFHFTLNGTTQTNPVFLNVPSGTYTLKVADGLGNIDSVPVVVPVSQPVVDSANTVITNTDCAFTHSGSVTLAFNGVPPFHVSWSNGDTTATATHMLSGVYYVYVTDSIGCVYRGAFMVGDNDGVHLGQVVIDTATCTGNNDGAIALQFSAGVAPYQVQWDSGDTSASIQNLYPGSYAAHITDYYGCQLDTVIQVGSRYQLTLVDTVRPVNCYSLHNGSVSLYAGNGLAPYTYVWSNGASSNQVNNLGPGVYQITISDQNDCLLLDTVTITEPPVLAVTGISYPTGCANDTSGKIIVTVQGGTPPYHFDWSNGRHSVSNYRLASGDYFLTVADSNGCPHGSSYHVDYLDSIYLTTSIDTPGCNASNGAIVVNVHHAGTVGGNNSYLWSTGDSFPGISNLLAGTYTLTVTSVDTITCRLVSTFNLMDSCQVGIENIADWHVDILPLPNGKSFEVSINLPQNNAVNLQVFNAVGQLINSYQLTGSNTPLQQVVDLSAQSAGIYFIRLQIGGEQLVKRVLVK